MLPPMFCAGRSRPWVAAVTGLSPLPCPPTHLILTLPEECSRSSSLEVCVLRVGFCVLELGFYLVFLLGASDKKKNLGPLGKGEDHFRSAFSWVRTRVGTGLGQKAPQ